jgi:hypothetical protein
MREKFTRYAGLVLNESQVAEIIDVVVDFERLSDMSRLAELVGARAGVLSSR